MKILLLYRPTDEGHAALKAARLEARLREATVLVARHVKLEGEKAPIADVPTQHAAPRETRSGQDVSKLREDLDSVAQDLRSSGIESEPFLVTDTSDPGKALLELARQQEVGLIVMGLRRRSPVGKLIMGSTSQEILLHADCPVLAVKA